MVLEHDGHLVGKFRFQISRDADAGMAGLEGEEEVVVAGETGLGGLRQGLTDDAPKRGLDHLVVLQRILVHVSRQGTG